MTLIKKSFEQMLEEIEFKEWIKYDILIPEEKPDLFRNEMLLELDNSVFSVKVPSFDYLYSLEKMLNQSSRLMHSTLSEIFLNAFERGNKNQEYLPISVKIFEGTKGYVLRIRDSGQGFEYKDIIKRMKQGKIFYHRGGYGLRNLDGSICDVAFEGDGSILNLQILNSYQ